MATALEELIERAKRVTMSPEDLEKQRRSFAYGNTKIENEDITRDSVDKAAARISKHESQNCNAANKPQRL